MLPTAPAVVGEGHAPPGDALTVRTSHRQNGKRPRIVIARPRRGRGNLAVPCRISGKPRRKRDRLREIATSAVGLLAMTNLGAIAFLTLARTSRRCSVGRGMPLPYNARQKASCSSPRSIFNFPLPSRSVPTHNVINIFVLWKKHKNPRGNPKRSLIIPSRRDLTNAGKCDKIKAQRESGAFKNTDPVFGIARQDRFVADRLGTPAFAAGAPFFFRRGREENQNV